ncbi:MAG: uroporphyrinogen decarboxylase [Planctomycetota bacterium]|nr:MAG: uroporphyrinogen decarboxylase [Planctomycetota bacterium]REK22593.1 MAG: uroporphyrinogen decarboxylase [Planctomycetota bacterium]REK36095.1 MAG: uroporphyrinogen decarboxylase [Planctomycetota bacterium]
MLSPELQNCRFLKAARCEPVDTTPIWIMRQAGRYMPEYMAVRSKVTFLELCKSPELAAEVTVTAQRVLGVDAAILFADLLPILEPMGFELEYQPNEGPVIHNPVRSGDDVERVRSVDNMEELGFVFDTVRLVRKELPGDIPLLGFAGAPFTLASYAIEGAGSRNYIHTKKFMYADAGAWNALMERLVESLAEYLRQQIAAGCQAVQVFDSWAGCLSPADYRDYALPHTQALLNQLPDDVPVIHFLTGNPTLLAAQAGLKARVIGLDWRCELAEAWRTVGYDRAVQGNLDPVTLFAEQSVIRERCRSILAAAEGRAGHIFNLGHGVLPGTPVEHVKALVEMVHEMGAA